LAVILSEFFQVSQPQSRTAFMLVLKMSVGAYTPNIVKCPLCVLVLFLSFLLFQNL
jgi:hypothetical protein